MVRSRLICLRVKDSTAYLRREALAGDGIDGAAVVILGEERDKISDGEVASVWLVGGPVHE